MNDGIDHLEDYERILDESRAAKPAWLNLALSLVPGLSACSFQLQGPLTAAFAKSQDFSALASTLYDGIEGFRIEKIKDGKSDAKTPAIVFVNGFLTQDDLNNTRWTTHLEKLHPRSAWYRVHWESGTLRKLAEDLTGVPLPHLQALLPSYRTVATTVALPLPLKIAMPLLAVKLLSNPWNRALNKAKETGSLLAIILGQVKKQKFIFYGHSLGARVIHDMLFHLAEAGTDVVRHVHLLGGAKGRMPQENWLKASQVTSSGICNYHSSNDDVLKHLYAIGMLFKSEPIGRHPIVDVATVRNVDVTAYVDGHCRYLDRLSEYAVVEKKSSLRRWIGG